MNVGENETELWRIELAVGSITVGRRDFDLDGNAYAQYKLAGMSWQRAEWVCLG